MSKESTRAARRDRNRLAPPVDRIAAALREAGWSAALLSSPENVYFASHAYIHTQSLIRRRQAMVIVAPSGTATLIVANVERGLAERTSRISSITEYQEFQDSATAVAARLLREHLPPHGIVGIETDHLPARDVETLRGACPGGQLARADDMLQSLRAIKSGSELGDYASGVRAMERAVVAATVTATAGIREVDLVANIVGNVYTIAGTRFRSILGLVASGANLLTTHHVADETRLKAGDLMRIGCRASIGPYHALIARTATVGEPSAEVLEIYGRLVDARAALLTELVPGAVGGDIFRRAAEFREAIGLRLATSHVGHGIGLEYQESPRLNAGSRDALAAGMVLIVVCVASIRDVGQLYLEDMVRIGSAGPVVLSDYRSVESPLLIEA